MEPYTRVRVCVPAYLYFNVRSANAIGETRKAALTLLSESVDDDEGFDVETLPGGRVYLHLRSDGEEFDVSGLEIVEAVILAGEGPESWEEP